jgi:hypothetical protein
MFGCHVIQVLPEGVETRVPQHSEWGQPVVYLAQGLWSDPVQPSLGVDPRFDHACIPEDPEVLGHRRLAHP